MERKKFADYRQKPNILARELKVKIIDNEDFKGNIALLKIKKVQEVWYIPEDDHRCVMNDNYNWFQMYPENKNYSFLFIYDENKNIVEIYIDVAKNLGIEGGVPYENDLFLDVVIVPSTKKITILDEDELEEAFKNKEVNNEEYKLAYKIKDYLIKNATDENIEKLTNLGKKYFNLIEENN